MSLKTDIDQLAADAAKMHEIVQGPSAMVQTTNGPVKSLKLAVESLETSATNSAAAAGLSEINSSNNAASALNSLNSAIIKANEAAASATAAANVAGAGKWVSGTSYTEGQTVFSPITYSTYRRKVAGAGTTDPSLDTTNWAYVAITEAGVQDKIESFFSRVNSIGVAGHIGFGVGICPALPAGMSKLAGTDFPASQEYGNYKYSDGSIMVWVPAYYYKVGTGANGLAVNVVSIKNEFEYVNEAAANADGYALHRAFYDGGAVQRGFFVDKYLCSNNGGIASSIALGNPLSSAAAHNPFNGLTGAPPNAYYGAFQASKTRGASFFPSSRFIFGALALLAMAHGQAATSSAYCAWYDATGAKNYPKGCNNNALKDVDDTTVTFTSDGNATYPTANKTGSGVPFAKTTHNGQACGIADLNGTEWEITPGLTSIATAKAISGATQANPCVITATAHGITIGASKTVMVTGIVGMTQLNTRMFTATAIDANTVSLNVDSTAFTAYTSGGTLTIGDWYALNTSVAMKNVTGGTTLATDHWGATGIAAMFTAIPVPMSLTYPNNGAAMLFGNGANQVLSEAVSGDNWKLAGLGMPKDGNAVAAAGTNLFGKDYYYQYVVDALCPISGGAWNATTDAGVWALGLNSVRTTSNYSVGFRSALYL